MVSQVKIIKSKYINAKKILIKYKLKHLCITITTNTSKDSRNLYFAPLRQVEDILIFGIIVYSTDQLKYFKNIFDNSTKAIFVDTEKKIPYKIGDKFKKNYIRRVPINQLVDYGVFYRILNGFFRQFFNSANISSASIEDGFNWTGLLASSYASMTFREHTVD